MSKEKQGIDLLKFIGSIMIFTIHMAVFESFGEVQSAWELLGRWAVPVFFIASAYFLFSANNGSVEYANIKKYIYRIGMLYLCWFIFNLPNFICVRFLNRGRNSGIICSVIFYHGNALFSAICFNLRVRCHDKNGRISKFFRELSYFIQ